MLLPAMKANPLHSCHARATRGPTRVKLMSQPNSTCSSRVMLWPAMKANALHSCHTRATRGPTR
eukprot:3764905-Pyramimonas_sp.AAC.1